MTEEAVKALIEAGIKDAHVEVVDTRGSGDHFQAIVISDEFEDISLVKRHQMVYASLDAHLTKEIHALQLNTLTNAEWKKQ
ncbi:MAG: BolA/IbaG family iron-sulfur metabolism protein [Candidatus Marinimicrobia bacterium]|jgi:acid stress-induced BolA-like protein IbaG/YrbA|nr:BolA/IbaG family iron-sulfur metabolism protein [Candidatus Neomarinimicrobiota bacterium]MBT3496084.1 BolA/IbaG family iron-sulfur metabolism protein [Candidatus Neomarinimicrobiota bacterium]MBT3691848.1 BolA/IbaG family iron-sulfur metabolism protein [Candidatus Neomarinimicrobiota bacterium]MBT3732512.1 BolA/IbaG family iron-sulfur metabolism protein [Candidatus Neomarinimicrobiota bacterium]MBT4145269.1 BolA/IbaG family iron-sulfur metabolism protein [Candidatus Neomarinimicrobiota bact